MRYSNHMKTIKSRQFKVIIEKDEDGFFVAQVPALPGCVTQAKSYDQLMVRLQEAMELCLEVEQSNKTYRKNIKQFSYNPSFVGIEEITLAG